MALSSSSFLERGEEGVGVVVGGLVREVGEAFRVLNDGDHALEAHAGIDVLGGKVAEGAVGFGVVLDEDEVPDFNAEIAVGVDELALGVALGGHVDVELGAGAAGAGVAHHPEVVFDVAVDDVDGGVEAFGFELRFPKVVGFLVEMGGVAFAAGRVNGGVEAFGRGSPSARRGVPKPSRWLRP